nr:immunoglobulin heavy chain junction region [Mus musculus]
HISVQGNITTVLTTTL